MLTEDDGYAAAEQVRTREPGRSNRTHPEPTRPYVSTDAARSAMARPHTSRAQTAMADVKARTAGDVAARRKSLTAKVWGIDDIAGTNTVDRAAAAVSYTGRTRPGRHHRRLRRSRPAAGPGRAQRRRTARPGGGTHAYDNGWDDVLGTYFEPRPAQAKALAELHSVTRIKIRTIDISAVLPAPGLAGLQTLRSATLADDPRFSSRHGRQHHRRTDTEM